jgi:hypothetical protein
MAKRHGLYSDSAIVISIREREFVACITRCVRQVPARRLHLIKCTFAPTTGRPERIGSPGAETLALKRALDRLPRTISQKPPWRQIS